MPTDLKIAPSILSADFSRLGDEVEAIDKAGSDDPIAVGKALEGLTFQGPLGEVQMRASDHQIQMQLMVSSLTGEYSRPIMYKGNDFHVAFATDGTISREDTTLPTTCDMQRPY